MAGAAVGVVASTAAVTKLQSKRLDAGGVLLHNALVGRDDPTSLTRQEVVDIGQRYASQLPSGMCCSKECVKLRAEHLLQHQGLSAMQILDVWCLILDLTPLIALKASEHEMFIVSAAHGAPSHCGCSCFERFASTCLV